MIRDLENDYNVYDPQFQGTYSGGTGSSLLLVSTDPRRIQPAIIRGVFITDANVADRLVYVGYSSPIGLIELAVAPALQNASQSWTYVFALGVSPLSIPSVNYNIAPLNAHVRIDSLATIYMAAVNIQPGDTWSTFRVLWNKQI